jgi:hypothetical protein
VLAVPYTATLAADKSLKLTISVAESSDGTNFDTAVKLKDAVTVATGKATTGSTETGLVEIDINLSGYKNYVKFSVTPDLTATGTDTCLVGATFALGGAERIPA